MTIEFELDGQQVGVAGGSSLLDALRTELGVTSVKDGFSPQGQCGCCTVLVDGQPRVACVTPASRVRGRSVVTVEGLPDVEVWAQAFCDAGASQCGFCTPGIILRLSALDDESRRRREAVDRALLAHLCRCTGWQTIREACVRVADRAPTDDRDVAGAERRAAIEGRCEQRVSPAVALGLGGFADDGAPPDALVALVGADGTWVVGESLAEARSAAASAARSYSLPSTTRRTRAVAPRSSTSAAWASALSAAISASSMAWASLRLVPRSSLSSPCASSSRNCVQGE